MTHICGVIKPMPSALVGWLWCTLMIWATTFVYIDPFIAPASYRILHRWFWSLCLLHCNDTWPTKHSYVIQSKPASAVPSSSAEYAPHPIIAEEGQRTQTEPSAVFLTAARLYNMILLSKRVKFITEGKLYHTTLRQYYLKYIKCTKILEISFNKFVWNKCSNKYFQPLFRSYIVLWKPYRCKVQIIKYHLVQHMDKIGQSICSSKVDHQFLYMLILL